MFASSFFSDGEAEDYLKDMVQEYLKVPMDWIREFHAPNPDLNVEPLLQHVVTPTLIMHGTGDRRVPFATAEFLNERIADSRLCPFPGTGHLPEFTAPRKFCEELDRFIQEG